MERRRERGRREMKGNEKGQRVKEGSRGGGRAKGEEGRLQQYATV